MELLLMLDAARDASPAHHGGHPLLRVRPLRQEGRAAHLDCGAPCRRSLATAGANRVLDDGAARAAGAWLLPSRWTTSMRSTFCASTSRTAICATPSWSRPTWATPIRPHLARLLNLPVAAASKRRLADDRVVIDTIVGDVEGKNVIIVDDEIANGGTVMEMLRVLREHSAQRVTVACTHGIFSGSALERLRRSRMSARSSPPTPCRSPRRRRCPTSRCSPSRPSSPKRSSAFTMASRSSSLFDE